MFLYSRKYTCLMFTFMNKKDFKIYLLHLFEMFTKHKMVEDSSELSSSTWQVQELIYQISTHLDGSKAIKLMKLLCSLYKLKVLVYRTFWKINRLIKEWWDSLATVNSRQEQWWLNSPTAQEMKILYNE